MLYRVLRVLVHHMQGVPCGRSLHKFGQFSGPKTRPKSYLICVFSGKKKKKNQSTPESLNLMARGRTRIRGWKPIPENSN